MKQSSYCAQTLLKLVMKFRPCICLLASALMATSQQLKRTPSLFVTQNA